MATTVLTIMLWGLLFVVPGIIKALEYSMVPWLLAENPTMTGQEARAISRRMTRGGKRGHFCSVFVVSGVVFVGQFGGATAHEPNQCAAVCPDRFLLGRFHGRKSGHRIAVRFDRVAGSAIRAGNECPAVPFFAGSGRDVSISSRLWRKCKLTLKFLRKALQCGFLGL